MDTDTPLYVVMAYEDVAMGKRAKEAFDYFTNRIGIEKEAKPNVWKFDALRIPKLMQMAANDAAKADMIILSIHSDRELPVEVKNWLDLSLKRAEERPKALVALVEQPDHGPGKRSPVRSYLQTRAEEANVDFFSNDIHYAVHEHEKQATSNSLKHSCRVLSGMDGVLAAPVSRWEAYQ